jgi:asparagine synthase (glutamine-hydrolysing)
LARQEGIAVRRYWEIPPVAQEDGARPEHEYIRECRELLEDAVRIRLRSDVPVGFHLSGGLDSSSVLALARNAMSQTPLTFSGAFTEDPRYDERPYIRTMVAALGTDHHEVIPQYGDFPGELASIIWYMDEPAVGPGVFPQLAVSRLCKQHVKVVLGGQGGDELFGGYQKYTIGYLRDYQHQLLHGRHALDPAELGRIAVNLAGKLQYLGVGNSMTKVLRRRRRGKVSWFTPEALAQVAPPADQPRLDATGDHLHQEMLWDMRYYLPGLLQVEDRVSMAVSIEARTPFLDYRVVEFAARLPPMLRLKNLITKYVVRQAVRDLLPARIVNRRDKRGFPTPIDIWFRQDLKDWVYEMLIGSPRLRQRGLFDPGIVARLYDEHQRGQDNSLALWSLLCVEVWFQTFIDRPVPATFMPHVESVSA